MKFYINRTVWAPLKSFHVDIINIPGNVVNIGFNLLSINNSIGLNIVVCYSAVGHGFCERTNYCSLEMLFGVTSYSDFGRTIYSLPFNNGKRANISVSVFVLFLSTGEYYSINHVNSCRFIHLHLIAI